LLEQLRVARAKKAQELQAIDDKLQAVEDGAFLADLGRKELSQMSTHEKSRVVSRIGAERFEALITSRR
jgi:hypothetical protein